jgi:hypothetical protein
MKTPSTNVIVLAGLPFVGAALGLALAVDKDVATALAPTSVAVTVAIAIFAVNFSFVVFQLAPYRGLLAGPSTRHLGAAAVLLLAALSPLAGAACGREMVGMVGIVATPLLIYAALLLVALGLSEARPARVMDTRTSKRRVNAFVGAFVEATVRQQEELAQLEIDPPGERQGDSVPPPMHEITHRVPPPPVPGDPFEACVATAEAALERDDATVFAPAVERLLELVVVVGERSFETVGSVESWAIASSVKAHALGSVERVANALGRAERVDRRLVLSDRFVEALARHVRRWGREGHAHEWPAPDLFWVGVGVCERRLADHSAGEDVIGILLVARQVTERTLRAERASDDAQRDSVMVEHVIASYARGAIALGEAAIEHDDADILFRCLETLGWIGSAAVRYGGGAPGRVAAGGLVQLGRLARYAQLECHWDRCPLTPYQHAYERLEWLATWVPQSPSPDDWLSSLSTAYSRLTGYERTLVLDGTDDSGRDRIQLREGEAPHTESLFRDGHTRTLDYSDESMLKEQVLW